MPQEYILVLTQWQDAAEPSDGLILRTFWRKTPGVLSHVRLRSGRTKSTPLAAGGGAKVLSFLLESLQVWRMHRRTFRIEISEMEWVKKNFVQSPSCSRQFSPVRAALRVCLWVRLWTIGDVALIFLSGTICFSFSVHDEHESLAYKRLLWASAFTTLPSKYQVQTLKGAEKTARKHHRSRTHTSSFTWVNLWRRLSWWCLKILRCSLIQTQMSWSQTSTGTGVRLKRSDLSK